MWGIDPRGDTTFETNAGLPDPFDRMLSSNGRIYGGQRAGLGTDPYNAALNPGGPPDADLDYDFSPAIQGQIQERIVAACDDYVAGTTEFD